jgi:HSP20 family protein
MSPDRDLFANFERMRREMDELFGDVFQRTGLSRRQPGFSPPVDVYYCSDPSKVVVKAELAGIDPDQIGLEIQGRELMITGLRRPAETEGRVYQQVEIEHGPFRRIISLGVDVRADEAHAVYEDGFLRIELPVAERERRTRQVPIDVPDAPRQEGSR